MTRCHRCDQPATTRREVLGRLGDGRHYVFVPMCVHHAAMEDPCEHGYPKGGYGCPIACSVGARGVW